jgi:hypothetical protein
MALAVIECTIFFVMALTLAQSFRRIIKSTMINTISIEIVNFFNLFAYHWDAIRHLCIHYMLTIIFIVVVNKNYLTVHILNFIRAINGNCTHVWNNFCCGNRVWNNFCCGNRVWNNFCSGNRNRI